MLLKIAEDSDLNSSLVFPIEVVLLKHELAKYSKSPTQQAKSSLLVLGLETKKLHYSMKTNLHLRKVRGKDLNCFVLKSSTYNIIGTLSINNGCFIVR